MTGREPERLRRGKAFHKKVQAEWESDAQGDVSSEKAVRKPNGRRGRIDVHVDAGEGHVAVVEIKASDWGTMTPAAVRRNVRRQASQVWDYVEAEFGDGATVSLGIVFPKRPDSPERLRLVEDLFEGEGIPVVWEDETVEERKRRADEESLERRSAGDGGSDAQY